MPVLIVCIAIQITKRPSICLKGPSLVTSLSSVGSFLTVSMSCSLRYQGKPCVMTGLTARHVTMLGHILTPRGRDFHSCVLCLCTLSSISYSVPTHHSCLSGSQGVRGFLRELGLSPFKDFRIRTKTWIWKPRGSQVSSTLTTVKQ